MLRLEEILKEKGIGITELAERLGVNRQTVYYYIKQDDKNPLAQLKKIADALEINLVELFSPIEKTRLVGIVKVDGIYRDLRTVEDVRKLLEDLEKDNKNRVQ
jgi:transcriptional regulator with XRE-family HTH domain